ncbi:MAG TPA: alpha/beta hydrolase [Jiangellales bacterium]|nr:alpha/beta hydrolase [Jiangellales bacterium]
MWWEQRGAGLSYRRDISPETMTVEQLVDDTLEVTRYVRHRFATDQVYLLGHSWGSFIGLQAAARAPELFRAYVGMAQITHQIRSEHESYERMLEQYGARGDRRMARRLERSPVTTTVPLPAGYDALRDRAMHGLGGGTTHAMRSVVRGIFLPSLLSRDYSAAQKVNLWRGKLHSRHLGLWDRMLATDPTALVPRLEIPAYFLHGAHDLTVSYAQARAYARTLQASIVGFYTFDHSAHSPAFEEPERTRAIFRDDVLTGSTGRADGPDPEPRHRTRTPWPGGGL